MLEIAIRVNQRKIASAQNKGRAFRIRRDVNKPAIMFRAFRHDPLGSCKEGKRFATGISNGEPAISVSDGFLQNSGGEALHIVAGGRKLEQGKSQISLSSFGRMPPAVRSVHQQIRKEDETQRAKAQSRKEMTC